MKKLDLIRKVAENVNESESNISVIVDEIFETITNTMANNEVVDICGFAKFEPVLQGERQSRNSKTGEVKIIPAKLVPKCRFKLFVKNKLLN